MAGRVDEVELVALAVGGLVVQRDALRLDRDAALALEVLGILGWLGERPRDEPDRRSRGGAKSPGCRPRADEANVFTLPHGAGPRRIVRRCPRTSSSGIRSGMKVATPLDDEHATARRGSRRWPRTRRRITIAAVVAPAGRKLPHRRARSQAVDVDPRPPRASAGRWAHPVSPSSPTATRRRSRSPSRTTIASTSSPARIRPTTCGIARAFDLDAVELDDDVAGDDARILGRGVGLHLNDQRTGGLLQSEGLAEHRFTSWIMTPSQPRETEPVSFNWSTTSIAISMGIAKDRP